MPTHSPLKRWKTRRRLTYAAIADMCRAKGWDTSAQYIKHVVLGSRRPSWEFAKFLSSEITLGEVTPQEIIDFYSIKHADGVPDAA